MTDGSRMNPVELHAHSFFSFLDALASPEELVRTAKSYGYGALALTDHGGMFGIPRFVRAAESAGVKAVVGCELYVSPTTRTDRSPDLRPVGHHLTLLAESAEGYENLARLSSLGYIEGFYHRPRIDRELLGRHAGGILLLTGCVHSIISQKILAADPKGAEDWLSFYIEAFGRDRVFVEIQDHSGEKEAALSAELKKLAGSRRLRRVLTNDVHYLLPDESETHQIVMDIRSRKLPTDPRRERFLQPNFHLLRPEEWLALGKAHRDAMETAADIAGRCTVTSHDLIPKHAPADPAAAAVLKESARRSARMKWGRVPADVESRIEEEVDRLSGSGLCSYIAMIADLVAEARRQKITIGPGRGSSAGSLICYLLDITEIDPIRYSLSFDRFLSPSRKTLPDVDIDVDYRDRGKVLEMLRQRQSSSEEIRPGVYSSIGLKSAVREVARCRGIAYQDVNERLRTMPSGAAVFEGEPGTVWKDLERSINRVAPLPRNTLCHPTAVSILPAESAALFPRYQSPEGQVWIQYDGDDLEWMGIPKLDLLPLKMLAVLAETSRWLKMSGIDAVDLSSIPLDDKETFCRLSEGRATGLFQLESAGMRDLLRDLEPRSIGELAAALALYRPGPLEAGIPKQYVDRKKGASAPQSVHPLFEDILRETYGLVLYQEQLMACACKAGLTARQADDFRIAASKKNQELMKTAGEAFERALVVAGLTPQSASHLLSQVVAQAEFAYNKAHAISYAVLTYRGAYLKTHHSAFFLAACINSFLDERDRLGDLCSEIRRYGIRVRPPDVNSAGPDCFPDSDGKQIRLGLRLIRHVPEQTVMEILRARPFNDIPDMLIKVPALLNGQALEMLAKAGALDEFGNSRIEILAGIPAWSSRVRQSLTEGGFQEELFGESARSVSDPQESGGGAPPPPGSGRNEMMMEHEAYGFFATASPMDPFQDILTEFCSGTLEEVSARARVASPREKSHEKKPAPVTAAGLLMDFRPHTDRAGREMAFGAIEDGTSRLDIVLFHDLYVASKSVLSPGAPLLVSGRLEKRGPFATLVADQVVGMDHPEQLYECVLIKLDEGIGMDTLRRIKEILKEHPGDRPVFVDMLDSGASYEFQAGSGCRPSMELRRQLEDLLGSYSVFFLKKKESVPARA